MNSAASQRIARRFRHFSLGAGVACAVVGALSLTGWVLGLPQLTQLPGFAAIRANTSIAALLLGAAHVGLLWGPQATGSARRLGAVAAAIAALIGALSLYEYAWGVDLRIDELLIRNDQPVKHPGRMALGTAAGLMLLGNALLLGALPSRWALTLSRALALSAAALLWLAFVGYCYGVASLYTFAAGVAISPQALITLLAVSLGIVAQRPEEGWFAVVCDDGVAGSLARRTLPVAMLVPLLVDIALRLLSSEMPELEAGALSTVAVSAVLGSVLLFSARELAGVDTKRREVEARYHLLFENMSAGCGYQRAIFDGENAVDYVFLEVNPSFEQMTGLQRDAILGKRATQVMPSIRDAQPDLITLYGSVASTGTATQLEVDFGPLGRSFSISVYCPSPGDFVTVFTDVTALRRHAHELEAMNHELEAFSYSVSHDLRAPLRSVDGFSEALLEDYADKLDDTGKDYLKRVRACAQRMAKLIEDLLLLSRTTRSEMSHIAVNLSELAQAVAVELKGTDPLRDVTFEIEPSLQVLGDPVLLRQLLENLLGNAFKFTSHHPKAHISFGQQEQAGERVFFVRDDGAGFDMAYAAHLFVAFQRLHRAEEFSGTGAGLAIVQRIVRRHGGRIWAQAAVEGGATFFFTLDLPSTRYQLTQSGRMSVVHRDADRPPFDS